MASNNTNDEAGELTAPIQTLVQESSTQPLLDHHRAVIQKNAADTIARELLTLTQGDAWSSDPLSYISTPVEQANGNKDYKHALSLGHWLGSLRIAINEQVFNSTQSADWFAGLLDSLEQLMPDRNISPSRELTRDIAKGRITLNEALELLAYGDVKSSSVTTVIGQGIRAVRRRTLP